jgi:surfeit locus 1 family protein
VTAGKAGARRIGPAMVWGFAILMVALTGAFIALGTWQMQRLAEKEALIAAVAARLDAPPVPLPPAGEWAGLDAEALNFQPVTATGMFRNDQAIAVFTSLSDGRGRASGPGYWIVTPLALQSGGSVFVNRGFVPENRRAEFMDNGPAGIVTVTGLARPGEPVGPFVPATNGSDRIEWVRNPERLAALADPALGPFAPLYIDLPAGPEGTLPQGGETVVEFPNNHLGYAITWYGFALITPIMLGVWLWRQRRGG